MTKKLTIEFIRQKIKESGDALLSKNYVNNSTLLDIFCGKCGNIFPMRWNAYQQGQRCIECGQRSKREKFQFSYDYVKKYIEDRGDELLSETYINTSTNLKIQCGTCSYINDVPFKRYKISMFGCKKCANEYLGVINSIRAQDRKDQGIKPKQRHTYEEIKEIFEKDGDTLISKTYEGYKKELKVKCGGCGKVYSTTFERFTRGPRCNDCSIVKQFDKIRTSVDDIRKYVKSCGDKLISDNNYKNYKSVLDIQCGVCNNIFQKEYGHYKYADIRCPCQSQSKGERKIKELLTSYLIEFSREVKFNDLIYKKNLRFDFGNLLEDWMIEYDGKQHFHNVDHFEEDLEFVQMKDIMKTNYCIKNKISILRIDFKNYNEIEDILSDFLDVLYRTKEQFIIYFSDKNMYKWLESELCENISIYSFSS